MVGMAGGYTCHMPGWTFLVWATVLTHNNIIFCTRLPAAHALHLPSPTRAHRTAGRLDVGGKML